MLRLGKALGAGTGALLRVSGSSLDKRGSRALFLRGTHLPVQAAGDDTNGACAPVDGEHEVMRVLWLLAMNGVSNHPIVGVDGIVLIRGCHLHHRSAWRGEGMSEPPSVPAPLAFLPTSELEETPSCSAAWPHAPLCDRDC